MKRFRAIVIFIICSVMLFSGVVVFGEEEPFQWDVSKESLLAGLWEADITAIHDAYDAGLLTCTEVTQYYLDRISAYNDTYNCFITLCDDALEQAAQKDALMAEGKQEGSLFGIPMVIKDNMDYAGYYTTNGYAKEDAQIAEDNAQVVEYLLREGAVIIGKTNMSTGAEDSRGSKSIAAGETKNAYNPELAPGGSSGGSAVAVSLNFAVAGLGTDTNSSLRLPAVLNGCVALRSTWNKLSADGIVELIEERDVPGAITRSVLDQAVMLDVLSGGSTNYAENLNINILPGLRIGVLRELSSAVSIDRSEETIDSEVINAFWNAVEELKSCGAEIVDVSIRDLFYYANTTDTKAEMDEMYAMISSAMEEADVCVLIFPSYLHTPQRTGKDANGTNWYTHQQTFINNTSMLSSCTGMPEIAIPIGNHSLGAGIGMEIVALKDQEQLILDISYAYTSQFNHRTAPENAGDIYSSSYIEPISHLIDSYYSDMEEYEEESRLRQLEESQRIAEEKEAENRRKRWAGIFTVMAVVISCIMIYAAYCDYLRRKRRRRRRKRQMTASRQSGTVIEKEK